MLSVGLMALTGGGGAGAATLQSTRQTPPSIVENAGTLPIEENDSFSASAPQPAFSASGSGTSRSSTFHLHHLRKNWLCFNSGSKLFHVCSASPSCITTFVANARSGSRPMDVVAEIVAQKVATADAKAAADAAAVKAEDTLKKLDALRTTLRNVAVSHTEALRNIKIPPPRFSR